MMRRGAAVFAAYLLLAVLVTWPVALHLGEAAIGRTQPPGEATPPLNIWAMAVVVHNLPRDPLNLFDGNAFYPYANTLAFSEHLFVPALMAWPVVALSDNWVLAYNLVMLLTLATAGLGMYLLSRELVGDDWASFGAGLIYAFHTWNQNELVRSQITANQWFPLVMLGLIKYFAAPGWGRAGFVGLMYLLQSLSCMYWALYLPFLVGGLVAFLWWRQRTPLRSLWPLASALALGVAVTALFAIPYLATARELGFERPEPISVPVDRYLDVLPENWLYAGFLGHALRNQNAAHFLGFLALALAVAGVLWRGAPEAAARLRPFLIVTALVGFVLSLGPWIQLGETTLAPGPYALLWRWVPGFRNVRYPERLSILLVLAFAPLVALGLARLRPRLGSLGAAALCGVLLLEHLSLPKSLSPLPAGAHIPSVYRWLRDQAEIQVIGEVPASPFLMERADALPMYLSTVHWKRTLQGYTSYFAPTYNFVKWRLGQFPGDASLGFLSRFGVDAVVVAPPAAAAIESLSGDPRVRIEGPFPEGHLVVQLPSARLDIPPPPDDDGGFVELERSGWDVEASAPGPGLAIDGDPRTAWATEQKQQQGDFYRVRFPAPVPLARISMVPDRVFTFPTAFKLVGQAGEEAVDLPFDAQLGYDRLFASLLHEPRRARLVLDLDGRELRGLRIRITETDPFAMTWIMSELRMYRRRPPP